MAGKQCRPDHALSPWKPCDSLPVMVLSGFGDHAARHGVRHLRASRWPN